MEVKPRTREEWEMDPEKYLLISIDAPFLVVRIMKVQDAHREGKFVKKEEQEEITGYKGRYPEDLFYEIIRAGHIANMQHAAYLGSELRRAYLALKLNKKYVQDSELDV